MKKNTFCFVVLIMLLTCPNVDFVSAQSRKVLKSEKTILKGNSFPNTMEAVVQPFYRHRSDGKPGREITLNFKGPAFIGSGTIELQCAGKNEVISIEGKPGIDHFSVLLPDGVGVKSDCLAKIVLRSAGKELSTSVNIPAKRQWTIYIYPHSHVDIGYTNTHANVELIHKRNLINGIRLAKKTANYPEGARYLWNPEVLWPVERYLKTASDPEKQEIIDAVKTGFLHLDAGYIHANSSSSADEELFEYFRFARDMAKLTGTKIETLVQVDIPGMSWGIIPVAARHGIKYCFAMNNGSDRVGHSTDLSFKPFWWLGPDGKSKILFLQPGDYTPGARAKGFAYWPLMAGQTDSAKLIQIVKTDHPRDNFIDKYLSDKLPELEKSDYYPYDIFAMSWAMADNTPIDADLPDAVKSWNEDYAFPHLIISGATEIMRTFEKLYGSQLPVLQGDFTEYWTDGLGTAAKQTGMNRNSKELLIQTETLWSMLRPGEPVPESNFNEAWRNVIMGTEHTWCYMNPSKQPITNDILKVKFGFFQKAEKLSDSLLKSTLSTINDSMSSAVGVFNTLSWPRNGLVTVPVLQSKLYDSVCEEKGRTVLSQRLSTGELVFFASDVPALGMKSYYLKSKKSKTSGKLAQGNILDNGIIKVVIDPSTGDISSLINAGLEFVDQKATCLLNSYRYLHGNKKNTTTGPQYAGGSQTSYSKVDQPINATGPSEVKIAIKDNGPLLATIQVESKAEGCNSLLREITVIAGQPDVSIKNTLEKQPILEKEGIHFGFGFNIANPVTRVDIPWGIMELEKDQLSGANRNWIAFQRWLDISNSEKGITWCSLDAPVFESGRMTANIIGGATNSPEWITYLNPSATIYSWALNNHWHTNFPLSQEGKIQFRYRILPHNSNYDAVVSNRFGMEQAEPLILSPIKANFKLKPPMAIQGSQSVVLSILKTSSDGKSTQVRLRSISNKDELVKLDWLSREPKAIQVIDLNSEPSAQKNHDEFLVPAKGFVTLNVVW